MNRVLTYDLVRAIAIFLVICIHSLGKVEKMYELSNRIDEAVVVNALYSVVKCAVPLFVMLSGALLIGKEESMKTFYTKRISRVIIPFFIWSPIIYTLLYVKNLKVEFVFWTYFTQFIEQTLTTGVVEVYWYIYMILGLYMITPFLRKMFSNMNSSESVCLLAIILVVYTMNDLYPSCSLVHRFANDNLIYLFYFCFGYVFTRYFKTLPYVKVLSIGCFLIGWGLSALKIMFGFISLPYVVMLSIGLFSLIVTCKPVKNPVIVGGGFFVSKVSYGIYLMHIVFISILTSMSFNDKIPLVIQPFTIAIITFSFCLLLFWILDKMKLTKWLC